MRSDQSFTDLPLVSVIRFGGKKILLGQAPLLPVSHKHNIVSKQFPVHNIIQSRKIDDNITSSLPKRHDRIVSYLVGQ